MTRICLNMIVKNEAERIERCLASVAPFIHSFAILDTGSADDTRQIIRDFMGARDIPGTVGEDGFVNFAASRNLALELAHGLRLHGPEVSWDYLLLVDADMELVAPEGLEELSAPGYQMLQRSGNLEYWNARFVRWDNTCHYVCPTHEYLDTAQPLQKLCGPYFLDHADGANRPGKIVRDIAMLEAEVLRDPSDARSWFYLGNSLRELSHFKQAAEAYQKRIELGGWDEEVYTSRLYLSRVLRAQNGFESTHAALEAFNFRSSRIEALADLAGHYRQLGMNEVAVMFARRGVDIGPSQDLLFVETGAAEQLASDLSICAFYSADPEIRKLGYETCDRLALDRSVSHEVRSLARQNLEFYLKKIGPDVSRGALSDCIFPSWKAHRLTFSPPDGYRQMAPSITRHGDRILAAQRCVNYGIDEGGYYEIAGHLRIGAGATIHTRTLLLEIDPDTLCESVHGEITLPGLTPDPAAIVQGFEDMRLISWRGELWGLSTVLDQNPDGRAEQWLATIDPTTLEMRGAHPIYPEGAIQPREKNWMPLVDGENLRFIYWSDPGRVIDAAGRTIAEHTPGIAVDHFRGGSQAIPFAGGWLAVIHWVQWFDGWPKYRHRFAWYDREYRLKKVSPGWVFPSEPELDLLKGYQYVTGLCWHPDERRLIMGFQVCEREAWVGTLDALDISRALMIEDPPLTLSPHRTIPQPPEKSGGSFLRFDDDAWVRSQTNRALQTAAQIDRATRMLEQHDLPEHPDRIKNWDNYLALHHAVATTNPSEPVLDAGGDHRSAFLPGLARLGFRRLISLNLDEPGASVSGGIEYVRGDITNSRMDAGSIHFIACLSVLEHGVNWRRFLDEATRLLVSGGHLFLSVDYWETPVSTAHVVFQGSYIGQHWEIFTSAEIYELANYAQAIGLSLVGDMDLRCRDRVASHLACDFTFCNLLFRR